MLYQAATVKGKDVGNIGRLFERDFISFHLWEPSTQQNVCVYVLDESIGGKRATSFACMMMEFIGSDTCRLEYVAVGGGQGGGVGGGLWSFFDTDDAFLNDINTWLKGASEHFGWEVKYTNEDDS